MFEICHVFRLSGTISIPAVMAPQGWSSRVDGLVDRELFAVIFPANPEVPDANTHHDSNGPAQRGMAIPGHIWFWLAPGPSIRLYVCIW